MFFIILSIVLSGVVYLYATSSYYYWKKKNVPHDPPAPFFGNNFDVIFGKISTTHKSVKMYKKYPNEKVVGYYKGMIPELFVHDPDIIRSIMSVDFSHFYQRGFGRVNTDLEPLALNLFAVEGDTWKLMRQRLTPLFTSAKLKSMYPLIVRCAEKLKTVVEKQIEEGGEVYDVRDLMARFATEFIGACGFGIDMDTINNEKSLYRELGKKMFEPSLIQVFKMGLYDALPPLRSVIHTGKKEVDKIMFNIITQICEQRNYKPSGRNDFIDFLLELGATGQMRGESLEKRDKSGKPIIVEKKFDFASMVAQSFVFFAAGFETSSSTSSYALHQLAFNPDVQIKVQEEIDRVLSKYDNKLCYDAVAEMSLLNMTVKESLRMNPPLGFLSRECAMKYTIPELDLTIDPGVKIQVPIQAIHMDERYYDNPEQFRPERFSPEEIKKRHKYVYMPFGEGPRNCIGSRLGEMQSMAGLAAFLHNFSVEPAECSKYKPDVEACTIVTMFKGGLPLRIKKRNK